MTSKILKWVLGGVGIFFILCSLVISLVEYNRFNAQPFVFPPGSTIAEIPVGGLDKTAATARLSEYFQLPLVLRITDATIHATPDDLGFSMDPNRLGEEAASQINAGSFWATLWNRSTAPTPVILPLNASVDEDTVLNYLNTVIAPRYTQPGSPLAPIPGTTNYMTDSTGDYLAIDQAVTDITKALLSPDSHHVNLRIDQGVPTAVSLQMLQAFLRHNINIMGFDQLVEIYLESMETNELLHFAVQGNTTIEPGVAFTAASTIKIPIMISVLRRLPDPTPEAVLTLFERMVVFSENPPADTLMSTYLDEVRGPLMVSEDLAELGMDNTFLAGYFYLGAPVLQIFDTQANTRADIFLDPDIYNQTIPAEAGQLLTAIYTCAAENRGLLVETFPGEISQAECQLMIDILTANKIGLLIEAGLPPEVTAAHKHGWVQELDGLLHSMSDVAIVFTRGGDYVLTIFIYDPVRLDFDEGNRLIARLSQTVYNFYNVDHQAHWWFD